VSSQDGGESLGDEGDDEADHVRTHVGGVGQQRQ